MLYVSAFYRSQMMVCSWDSFVDTESIARIVDTFVNSLDLTKMVTAKASAPPVNWKKAVKSITKLN